MLAASSCVIDDGFSTSTRGRLTNYAEINSYRVLERVNDDFKTIYCAEQYLKADPVTRDVQWFARTGKCLLNDKYINLSSGYGSIETNGIDLLKKGALRLYDGFRVTCEEDSTLTFTSEALEFHLDNISVKPTSISFKENGRWTIDRKDGYVADFDSSLPILWDLTQEPSYGIGDAFAVNGGTDLSIKCNGDERDWVKITYNGRISHITTQTSRD